MKSLSILCLVACLLTACRQPDEQAVPLLQRATNNHRTGNFSLAKLQIDSIRTLYPKAFETRRKALSLMQDIELDEQRRSLVYLDSLEAIKSVQADSLKRLFVFEKDTAYQETGNYFYPSQVAERYIQRSILRGQVSEDGEMLLTSVYCAGGQPHHRKVRVSCGDFSAETPMAIDSYETTIGGRHVELADYKATNDGGVLSLITTHADSNTPIRLAFIGEREYSMTLASSNIKALVELKRLSGVLGTLADIRKNRQEAQLKIRFIERKKQETK